jgi:hypothetical protein
MARIALLVSALALGGCSSGDAEKRATVDVATTGDAEIDASRTCSTFATECPIECAAEEARVYDQARTCVSSLRVVACMPRPTICSTPLSACLVRDGTPYGFTLDCQLQNRDHRWRACTADEAALLQSPVCP